MKYLLITLKDIVKKDKFLFIFVLIIVSIPNLLAIFYSFIGIDAAGYYLPIVERLNEGFILYRDLPSGYTPLVEYIFLLLKKIFSIGPVNYELYAFIHFIFQYISAFYIYKITLFLTKTKSYSLLSVLLYFLAIHWNQGNLVLLEVPSVMFGMAAIYYTLISPRKPIYYIGIGILVVFAFLSKQYGLGFFFLVAYLIWFNSNKWKNYIFYIIGFIIPLIFCFYYFGENFKDILVGNGYGGKFSSDKVLQFLNSLVFFFHRIFPCLIVGFILLITTFRKNKQKHIIVFLLLGIFGFSFQFVFAKLPHYYIYMVPFAAILTSLLLSYDGNKKMKILYQLFVALTVLLLFYSTYRNRVYKEYLRSDIRKNQYELAEKIKSHIPSGSTLYIADIGLVGNYYLTGHIPPNMDYSFGPAIDSIYHYNAIKSADFVLRDKKEQDYFNHYSEDVKKFLQSRKYVEITDSIILYDINSEK